MEGESGYYVVDVEEAAARLHESPDRVRDKLARGELEGIPPGATAQGDWKVLLPATTPDLEEPAPVDEPLESSSQEEHEEREEAPVAEEAPDEFVEPPEAVSEADERPAATGKLERGDAAANDREPTAPSGWVSTQQAARALGISPRTVRWHIEQGNLAAKSQGEGVRRSWLVSIDSLQAFRDSRQNAGEVPRGLRGPAESAAVAAETGGNAIRELADRLAEEATRAAEYRVRLELTEQAASTVRAELGEERRRREAAERERDELRRQLEDRSEPQEPQPAPPSASERVEPRKPPVFSQGSSEPRSWWRRIFGG